MANESNFFFFDANFSYILRFLIFWIFKYLFDHSDSWQKFYSWKD